MSRLLIQGLVLSVMAAAFLHTNAEAQPTSTPVIGPSAESSTIRGLTWADSGDAISEAVFSRSNSDEGIYGGVHAQNFKSDSSSIDWEDDILYEGRSHIKVTTPRAVYFYDKAGGGFSRIIDSGGRDWVGWHPQPDEYPAGGAGLFRGVPNYQDGPGHPGYDACTSQVDDSTSEQVVIRSTCRNGTWEFTWMFYPHYAKNHVVTTPENIWFLYEGPIAGRYAPENQYWGNEKQGYQTTTPNWVGGERERGEWQWAYFGDNQVDRVLFLAMEEPYTNKAVFGYLGAMDSGERPELALNASEGMVVFGFGREEYPDKHIVGHDKTFYLGFVEQKVTDLASHDEVARHIKNVIEKGEE